MKNYQHIAGIDTLWNNRVHVDPFINGAGLKTLVYVGQLQVGDHVVDMSGTKAFEITSLDTPWTIAIVAIREDDDEFAPLLFKLEVNEALTEFGGFDRGVPVQYAHIRPIAMPGVVDSADLADTAQHVHLHLTQSQILSGHPAEKAA